MRWLTGSIILSIYTIGCETSSHRDPSIIRVAIDSESIDPNHLARIQAALIASGQWVVVDRGAGLEAAKEEQALQNRNEKENIVGRERWTSVGNLYGVSAIIIATVQCQPTWSSWHSKYFNKCQQMLSLISTKTGEVIAAAEGESEIEGYNKNLAPSWYEVVEKLEEAMP